jgi:hypothetical protein
MNSHDKRSFGGKLALAVAVFALPAQAAFSDDGQVVARKVKILNGERYTFTKYIDDAGNTRSEIVNDNGQPVSLESLPPGKQEVVDPRVIKELEKLEREGRNKETIAVRIALDLPDDAEEETPEVGEAEVLNGATTRGSINGVEMSEKELNDHANKRAHEQRSKRSEKNAKKADKLKGWAKRHGLAGLKGLDVSAQQGRKGATLHLTPGQLRKLLKADDAAIEGIELHEPGEDDIASAMIATNITNSALPYRTARGNNIGIYMTESGCAADRRITNYDRLAGSETNHSRNVGAIIRAVSPNSYLYCRGGAKLPRSSDLDGVGGNPPIYIITRSNSSNDSTSYNTLDRDWDNYAYYNYLAIFNSGGNTGTGTGNVRSPGKGLNIISIGNYNDSNNTIVNTSPFVDPNTDNDKPEVVAPGATITAGGFIYTGTSQATPHAAAFTADMMSSSTYLKYRPYLAKAKLLAGATDSISGGYDKVGLGGIDFRSAEWSGYAVWYAGSNSSFSNFDSQDGSSDGYVTKRIYISSSWDRARVVLAWMNRGSYTYAHRSYAFPMGMDLDLTVYNPYGNWVGGSYSWDNPYERVNFTPTVSGYYTFKIKRKANRDTRSALLMGLYVNYYNGPVSQLLQLADSPQKSSLSR